MVLSSTAHSIATKQFTGVYTDRLNKVSWSERQGIFSNGCVDSNGNYDPKKCTLETDAASRHQVEVESSRAATVCRDIGARLPTKIEFESLIRNFDHAEASFGPYLTYRGQGEMRNALDDRHTDPFDLLWTSSVDPKSPERAFVFSGYNYGHVGHTLYRHSYDSVRCVVGP